MVSSTLETIATGNELAHVTRPAKGLIGWMSQNEAQLLLAGRRVDRANNPEYVSKAQEAIAAVQSRPVGIDQSDLISDTPSHLDEYLNQFKSHDAFNAFRNEGWDFKIADLSKVCAAQPVVFWDHATERTIEATEGDLLSIAKVTLPLPEKAEIPR